MEKESQRRDLGVNKEYPYICLTGEHQKIEHHVIQ